MLFPVDELRRVAEMLVIDLHMHFLAFYTFRLHLFVSSSVFKGIQFSLNYITILFCIDITSQFYVRLATWDQNNNE